MCSQFISYLKWFAATLISFKIGSIFQILFKSSSTLFLATGVFQQQNITVLIGGSQSESHACSLSTVTGIPLIRLYERLIQFNQCNKTVDMSVDYRYFAHATSDVLASFHWRKISLVFDGNQECLRPPLFRGKLP